MKIEIKSTVNKVVQEINEANSERVEDRVRGLVNSIFVLQGEIKTRVEKIASLKKELKELQPAETVSLDLE